MRMHVATKEIVTVHNTANVCPQKKDNASTTNAWPSKDMNTLIDYGRVMSNDLTVASILAVFYHSMHGRLRQMIRPLTTKIIACVWHAGSFDAHAIDPAIAIGPRGTGVGLS